MANFLKFFQKFLDWRRGAAKIPVVAMGQHRWGFGLVLLALLSLGATFDWSEDARWELRSQDQTLYRLDETMAELGAPPTDQEMFVLDKIGLLVRQRNNRAVNLTVLKGDWDVLRNGQVVGRINAPLADWLAQLGEPLQVFANPQKVGVIYYYRGSLIDMGLMVAEDRVLSVMFVEPGYLRSALERSGYSPKQ